MTSICKSKSAWVNKQHELITAMNRQALKNIKQTAKMTMLCMGGNTFDIPKDNLVLLRDHSDGRDTTQDNYKSKLFIIALKHKDPNSYTFLLMCVGGPVHTVNQQQLLTFENYPLGIVMILIP